VCGRGPGPLAGPSNGSVPPLVSRAFSPLTGVGNFFLGFEEASQALATSCAGAELTRDNCMPSWGNARRRALYSDRGRAGRWQAGADERADARQGIRAAVGGRDGGV
jgi:hypothetical protein